MEKVPTFNEFIKMLQSDMARVVTAHSANALEGADVVRRFDKLTPYAVHPVWCAMTIMQEPKLSPQLRYTGARVLLFHDFKEDTRAQLPADITAEEECLIDAMTFNDLNHEMEEIWSREKLVWLLKLYDKTSNVADGSWMTKDRRKQVVDYVLHLANAVEERWGSLNIGRFSRALCAT